MTLLDDYVRYHSMFTDADPLYAKMLFIQRIGWALGKKSHCNITPDVERLNLYILLIGASFDARKTVSQEKIIKTYLPHDLLATDSSPEKYLSCLADDPNGVLHYGEFSKVLKHIKAGKGYLNGFAEVWNDLYRYEREFYIRALIYGTIIIQDPYPVISATCTEEVLKKCVDEEMLDGGFMGRFIMVPGKVSNDDRKIIPQEAIDGMNTVINDVLCIDKHIPEHGIEFILDTEALARFNEIEKDLIKEKQVRAIAGRYGQAIIPIACILEFLKSVANNSKNSNKSNNINNSNDSNSGLVYKAVETTIITNITQNSKKEDVSEAKTVVNDTNSNDSKYLTIISVTKDSVNEAYTVIKPCIKFARRLREYVGVDGRIAKVKDYVEQNHKCRRTDVQRYTNLSIDDIHFAMRSLGDKGLNVIKDISYSKIKSNGVKSKPTHILCWLPAKDCETCKLKKYCNGDD